MPAPRIAIIAHVDHGKTTLVDKSASGRHLCRAPAHRRTGDGFQRSGKSAASPSWPKHRHRLRRRAHQHRGHPGHADFGGEVERVLSMVDSVLLLVDAVEGPMPQTRFVTKKALALGPAADRGRSTRSTVTARGRIGSSIRPSS